MYDRELALEVLKQLHKATVTLLERFKPIESVSNYTDSSAGMEKQDAVCMLLIAIGESLKNHNQYTSAKISPNRLEKGFKSI